MLADYALTLASSIISPMFVRRFDVLLLIALVTARVRIDTLADLAAPRPIETIRKIAWLDRLLSPDAWKLMEDWLTDPLSLLLISLTFALVLGYVLVDWLGERPRSETGRSPARNGLKLALLFAIVGTTVVAQSAYLVTLRHSAGPATYTHDGGVIQTEEAMKFVLQGKNPYTEDYTHTPMADWGLDYKTALYHFPYLPWTFLFSLPFFLTCNAAIGWFDERVVYLLLFVLTLLMAARLAPPPANLALVMLLGLNPIMGSDVIFGQNDSFVLFWLVAAFWLANRGQSYQALSAVAFALACASKPTAWFLAPFYFLYLVRDVPWRTRPARLMLSRLAPFAAVFAVIVLPFVFWDPYNFYDDVWAWSAGTSPTAYQIRGWGLSNLVLALDWVPSRLGYFPFWVPELIVSVPLFLITLRRQWRENTLANVAWHGALLFFAYAYVSRFLNENYLGFVVALLALGVLMCAPDLLPSGTLQSPSTGRPP